MRPPGWPVLVMLLAVGGCAHERYQPVAESLLEVPGAFASLVGDVGPTPEACAALNAGPVRPFAARVAASNLDLAGAVASLRRAQALAVQARSPRLPRFDAQAAASRGTVASGSTALSVPGVGESVTESWQGSLAASYELDAWGRVGAAAQAAALDADQSAELLASLRVTAHAQTLETWFSLVAQRRLIDLLEEQAASSSRFLELTRLRFGLGQTVAQDIGRQRQNLLAIQGQLAQAREGASILESRLAALAGATIQDLNADLPRRLPALPRQADPGPPSTLAARRPDVRAAMAALAAADRRTAVAAADRLPRLTLTGSLVTVEQTIADLFSDTLWQAGVAAGVPVFDAGASRARIDAAEATAEARLYDWAATLLTALREVEDALVSNRRQAELVQSLEDQLVEAVRVLELTRDFYRMGQGDYLDVLTALLSRQSLERQRLGAERQQFINRITLCRALGVGPDAATANPPTAAATRRFRDHGDQS